MYLRTFGGIAALGSTLGLQVFAAVPPIASDVVAVRQRLSTLAVPFVANAGQWDKRAAFAAQTFAGTLFVTTAGALVYSLPGKATATSAEDHARVARPGSRHEPRQAIERTHGWVLTETFIGADRQPLPATPSGARPAAAKVS
ncbi:MAG: hypothetical protein IPO58_27015 [Betaproteobacteria bacterium]|nr:hypothetical protein [Betaproteobacteria bacterium]